KKEMSAEVDRWEAARWHLSSSFGGWGEDFYGSAAQVWYAIEVFVGKKTRRIAEDYLRDTTDEAVELLLSGLAQQRHMALSLGEICSWPLRGIEGDNVDSWMPAANSKRSAYSWKHPWTPDILVHPEIGLLGTLAKAKKSGKFDPGLSRRLESDLKFLYVLRNKVVHEGSRIFSSQFAAYLGRLGLEVLFNRMDARRSDLRNSAKKT
ncbi:MAG TPA: hypothetical protein VMF58_18115, partial [Rhizomicrobium sp.]|nr:hypothetical protein [Rhizomicrobium sp.]